MNKYICIHGHFYQPPRDNPWLNDVEVQDTAYPYHDWNHRITDECYSRNAASRILDDEGRIIDIVNNYAYISFNFGPTLLQWMEKQTPEAYQAIINADRESQERFSGHGAAIAQAYNHMIMPLANERDKETQVIWGIKDFESRFGRKPEGMWCGETAMNTDTLELMAKYDIKFTILSPYQAKAARKSGGEEWTDVAGGKIDPMKAYICNLPSGKKISIFFYDGPVSQGIAFERLLNSGEMFADRLLEQFDEDDEPQLMHIATDGETYGHHHRHGEMALSFCLNQIDNGNEARITIYGEFLEKYPPRYEVQILENTSWSCYHGIERWRGDCGCNSGMYSGWHQKWRGPLRDAFDWVRDQLIVVYEKAMSKYVKNPWKMRDEYIEVIRDRSEDNVIAFLMRHIKKELLHKDKVKVLKLLEMQYHTMLMYTSCGWFFDEVTGIESMQDILYATRAIQLAKDITNVDYEGEFISLLQKVPSNKPEYDDASQAYKKTIQPAILDMLRVGAHYAVSSIFNNYQNVSDLYSYIARSENYDCYEAGKYKLATGKAFLRSGITWEEQSISFAVLHLGEHQLFGGVREFVGPEAYKTMQKEIMDAFDKGNVQEVLLLMDKHFGTHKYSFWHLFRDDQKRILDQVLSNTLIGIEGLFRQIYENHYPLMQAFNELSMHLPKPLKITGDFIINSKLKRILEKDEVDLKELKNIKDEIAKMKVEMDTVTLNFIATERISEVMEKLAANPQNTTLMSNAIDLIQLTQNVPLQPELWKARNIAFIIRKKYYTKYKQQSIEDAKAKNWCEIFDVLFSSLNLKAIEIELPNSIMDLEPAAVSIKL